MDLPLPQGLQVRRRHWSDQGAQHGHAPVPPPPGALGHSGTLTRARWRRLARARCNESMLTRHLGNQLCGGACACLRVLAQRRAAPVQLCGLRRLVLGAGQVGLPARRALAAGHVRAPQVSSLWAWGPCMQRTAPQCCRGERVGAAQHTHLRRPLPSWRWWWPCCATRVRRQVGPQLGAQGLVNVAWAFAMLKVPLPRDMAELLMVEAQVRA